MLEKERSCWFEQKVNDLQAVLHEWETKDMLRKEREYEEKAEAKKKENMIAEIRERIKRK